MLNFNLNFTFSLSGTPLGGLGLASSSLSSPTLPEPRTVAVVHFVSKPISSPPGGALAAALRGCMLGSAPVMKGEKEGSSGGESKGAEQRSVAEKYVEESFIINLINIQCTSSDS